MQTETLDLSFRPSRPARPNRLTRDEIKHYNREGYVRPFDIFTGPEIARIRAYVDGLMAAMGEAGAYGINCYQARLAGLWDVATDPRILDCVEDIVGPDVVCWASAILSKRPGDPREVPWHQDASFWKLTPARTVTVWLAIDDVDAGNAAMRFLPRSHDRGRIAETAMGEGSVFHKGIVPTAEMGAPVSNDLSAGQISLHADMLVHGSPANRSDRRRCGLTLRYCPVEVRAVDPAWAAGVEGILCRGRDPSGYWTRRARPGTDDIAGIASPHVVGNN
jgi:hypothetical protein